MLDLRQLSYFVTVAELQNVGGAANKLGISQSPLSRQIKQLEAHLGLELFRRDKQRLHLTHAGRELLAQAKELLAQAHLLEQRARRTSADNQKRLGDWNSGRGCQLSSNAQAYTRVSSVIS